MAHKFALKSTIQTCVKPQNDLPTQLLDQQHICTSIGELELSTLCII